MIPAWCTILRGIPCHRFYIYVAKCRHLMVTPMPFGGERMEPNKAIPRSSENDYIEKMAGTREPFPLVALAPGIFHEGAERPKRSCQEDDVLHDDESCGQDNLMTKGLSRPIQGISIRGSGRPHPSRQEDRHQGHSDHDDG